MIIILTLLAIAAAYAAVAYYVGLSPFGGRVDDAADNKVWYEAANSLQIRHVQGAWSRRMAKIAAEGRLFMVPGRDGCTTWDDLRTWEIYAEKPRDLPHRTHYLRINHNHWRHDMDNDAIAIEFETPEALSAFKAAIPADGPKRFDFRELLGPQGAKELDRLLIANRARGHAERV